MYAFLTYIGNTYKIPTDKISVNITYLNKIFLY